jgi:hypothetical protein
VPSSFAKLKAMFLKETKPKHDLKHIAKQIAAIEAKESKVCRNLAYVDKKYIGEREDVLSTLEDEKAALKRELTRQQDVDQSVLAILESISLLCSRDPASVKKAARNIPSIVCCTSRNGEGGGHRHILKKVRLLFVGGVTGKSHPRLRLFRPPLIHLSYRPILESHQQKKPGLLVTPGFLKPSNRIGRIVTSARGARGYSLRDRSVSWTRRFAARNNPHLCVLDSVSAVNRTWKRLLQLDASESANSYVVAGGLPS